jgi:hypothetical protein
MRNRGCRSAMHPCGRMTAQPSVTPHYTIAWPIAQRVTFWLGHQPPMGWRSIQSISWRFPIGCLKAALPIHDLKFRTECLNALF